MRRRPELLIAVLLALGLALVLPLGLHGQDSEPGSAEGALFLLLPVGAQGVALGRAMTAVPSPESAFWNPAGLASMEKSQLVIMRGDHLVGEGTALSGLMVRQPIGVVGLSYELLDEGEQDLTDIEGNVRGAISVRSHVGIVSLATRLTGWLDVGFNLKVVQFNLSCTGQCDGAGVRSTGWAMDAGVQSQPIGGLPLRLGAMLAHLGPDFQVVNAEQADPLPSRIRVSAAYNFLRHFVDTDGINLWVRLEVEDRWRDPGDATSYYVGTELTAGRGDVIYVRSGYVQGEVGQADGMAIGVGLRYERFELGLAKNLAGSITGESEPVHVSFGIGF